MMWLDIAVLLIAVIFVVIGIWKGFLRLIVKCGALVPAVVLARVFGGFLGVSLFPTLISADSSIAKKLSVASLENINESLSKILGTLVLFAILYILFRIILGVISRMLKKEFKVTLIDRFVGGIFGLVIALGTVYLMAFAVNVIAMTVAFFDSGSSIYSAVDKTVVFKYFF